MATEPGILNQDKILSWPKPTRPQAQCCHKIKWKTEPKESTYPCTETYTTDIYTNTRYSVKRCRTSAVLLFSADGLRCHNTLSSDSFNSENKTKHTPAAGGGASCPQTKPRASHLLLINRLLNAAQHRDKVEKIPATSSAANRNVLPGEPEAESWAHVWFLMPAGTRREGRALEFYFPVCFLYRILKRSRRETSAFPFRGQKNLMYLDLLMYRDVKKKKTLMKLHVCALNLSMSAAAVWFNSSNHWTSNHSSTRLP